MLRVIQMKARCIVSFGTIVISTGALVYVASRMMPTGEGYLGHDYGYFLPYLLSGMAWAHQNGWLEIPHFTPDFCGGIPWLANPQSLFYSIPQVLTVALADPVTAVRWSLLLFATIGAGATYILFRR